MKNLSIFITTLLLVAQSAVAGPANGIVNSIKGVYEGCAVSIHGAPYTDYYKITIDSDGRYVRYAELHRASDCSDAAINKIEYVYNIDNAEVIDNSGGEKTINLDLEVDDITVLMAASNYPAYLNNIAECGYTNWTNTDWFNITGKMCPFLLGGDSFHDTYRAQGDMRFVTIKSRQGQDQIDIPTPFTKSGDDAFADREDQDFITVEEI